MMKVFLLSLSAISNWYLFTAEHKITMHWKSHLKENRTKWKELAGIEGI